MRRIGVLLGLACYASAQSTLGYCLLERNLQCSSNADCELPSRCICDSGQPVCPEGNADLLYDFCNDPTDSSSTTAGSCACQINAGDCVPSIPTSYVGKEGYCEKIPWYECDTLSGGCVFTDGEIGCTCIDGEPVCSETGLMDVLYSNCGSITSTDSSSTDGSCTCYANLGECLTPKVCSNQTLVTCLEDQDCYLTMPCTCDGEYARCADEELGAVDYNCCSTTSGGHCECYVWAGECVNTTSVPTTSTITEWPGWCEHNSSIRCDPNAGGCVFREGCMCLGLESICLGTVAGNPRSFVETSTCGSSSSDSECECYTHYGECLTTESTTSSPAPAPPTSDCIVRMTLPGTLAHWPAVQFYERWTASRRNWICDRTAIGEGRIDFGPHNYMNIFTPPSGEVTWLKLYKVYIAAGYSFSGSAGNPCELSIGEVFGNATSDCYDYAERVLATAFPLSNQHLEFPPCNIPLPQIHAAWNIKPAELKRCYDLLSTAVYGPV